MVQIKQISDINSSIDTSALKKREAVRAVLFDEENKIPLLFVSKHNYHKLPGGGIDEGETKEEALVREILEEVGSEIQIEKELGETHELRKEHNLDQTSYSYLGKIISKGEPNFTQKEIDNGFQLIWLTLDEAIQKIKQDKPDNYEGKFIQKRDLAILENAKISLNQK